MSDVILEVTGVSKKFSRGAASALRYGARDILHEFMTWRARAPSKLREGEFWAARDISFELRRGESLAVIGSNGAGKSTLLKLISGLLKPDTGRIVIRGRLRAMIELGAGFNASLSGRENVFAQGAFYGYSRKELQKHFDEIVDFAEIAEFIDAPVQQYSDGMRARLAFAIAVHLRPELLLVDEVLAVGDMSFQNKCMRYIRHYVDTGGSLLFVGHGSHQVQAACRRGLVLARGEVAFAGGVVEALDHYIRQQQEYPPLVPPEDNPDAAAHARDSGVTIDHVTIGAAEGGMIRWGGTGRIDFRYHSPRPLPRVRLGFMILTRHAAQCLGGGVVIEPVTLHEGTHDLSFLLPDLPLLPGSYLLRLALSDLDVGYPVAMSGWSDAPHPFEIQFEPHAISNLSAMSGVHVAFHARWVQETAAAPLSHGIAADETPHW